MFLCISLAIVPYFVYRNDYSIKKKATKKLSKVYISSLSTVKSHLPFPESQIWCTLYFAYLPCWHSITQNVVFLFEYGKIIDYSFLLLYVLFFFFYYWKINQFIFPQSLGICLLPLLLDLDIQPLKTFLLFNPSLLWNISSFFIFVFKITPTLHLNFIKLSLTLFSQFDVL